MKALLMLILALSLSSCFTREGAEIAESPCKLTETQLRELVKKAADWKVPQPAHASKLIKIPSHSTDSSSYYSLGFIEPSNPDLALVGFTKRDITGHRKTTEIPDPAGFPLDDIVPTSPFGASQELNTGLITGIQLVRMGHTASGSRLIQKSLGEDSGHHRSSFRSPAHEKPELMLARSCLAAAINDISSTEPDFAVIHSRITRLIRDQPGLDSDATESVLRSLDASMRHKPAAPGTIDRIVDDYLLSGGISGGLSFQGHLKKPAETALILKGFEAVPALLAQRKSERFSTHLMQGFNNFVSYPMSAGQVIDAYLQRLANDELGSDWLRRQHGSTPEDDAVVTWWKEASAMGEERYVKSHAIVEKEHGEVSLSEELIMIANDRYPKLLPEFYRKALMTPHGSGSIDGFLAFHESIPFSTRIKLLKQGVATNLDPHRNSALHLLRSLDPVGADGLLLEIIRNAPKSPRGEYWLDQDANVSSLVAKSTSLEVWRALDDLITRGNLGMKMELIDHLEPDRDGPPEITSFYLSILDRHINNRSIRRNWMDKRFDGPGAGFPHESLSMRNYIHTRWAHWLEMGLDEPEECRQQRLWTQYRRTVSQAIRDYRTRTQ